MFILLCLTVNIIFIPLCLCFDISFSFDENAILFSTTSFIPLCTFLIDIILTLNTSFYSKGALIDDKASILKDYFYNHLFLDFITIGPMTFSVFGKNFKLIEISFLLRIAKLG